MEDLNYNMVEKKFNSADADSDGKIMGKEEALILVNNLGLVDKDEMLFSKFQKVIT